MLSSIALIGLIHQDTTCHLLSYLRTDRDAPHDSDVSDSSMSGHHPRKLIELVILRATVVPAGIGELQVNVHGEA